METFEQQRPNKSARFATIMIASLIFFFVGYAVILSSTAIGQSVARAALTSNGGSMDTAMYQFIMSATTENVRLIGAILSLVAGVSALLAVRYGFRQKKA